LAWAIIPVSHLRPGEHTAFAASSLRMTELVRTRNHPVHPSMDQVVYLAESYQVLEHEGAWQSGWIPL